MEINIKCGECGVSNAVNGCGMNSLNLLDLR